jgi:hypothetical protein
MYIAARSARICISDTALGMAMILFCRTGNGGKTCAAVAAMRRVFHDGHTSRPLQEKAIRKRSFSGG